VPAELNFRIQNLIDELESLKKAGKEVVGSLTHYRKR
jgi:hypothetical protein